MVPTRKRSMTVAEFLAWDDGSDTRYELLDGEIVAMATPTIAHSRLIVALAARVQAKLAPPCTTFAEVGIAISDHRFYQADFAVDCGRIKSDQHSLPSPILIAEILSPTTAGIDKRAKVPDYRELTSVQEIVLLSSMSVRAEIYRRTSTGWTVEDVKAGGLMQLTSVGLEVRLDDLYEGIDFASA